MSRGRGDGEEAISLRNPAKPAVGLAKTPLNVLAVAAHVVDNDNGKWIKYDDYHQDVSSSSRVRRLFENIEFKPSAEEYAQAVSAVEWLAVCDDDSEYIQKLKAVLENATVSEDSIGFFASGIIAYNRSQERPTSNEYAGTPGNKYGEPEAKVFSVRVFDTSYGDMWVYRFRDPSGRNLVVKTSRFFDIKRGDIVRIVGVVKAHQEDRNGDKETVLTRAKIINQSSRER